MSRSIEVVVTHSFQASAKRVYDAWLDPHKVRVWLAAALRSMGLSGEIGRVEIDATVGGAFLFSDMREGVEAKHWGTYLELERPEKIVFTWLTPESENDSISRVALVLEPQGEGCVATITHQLDVRWAEDVDKAENGWSCMLAACGELLGSD